MSKSESKPKAFVEHSLEQQLRDPFLLLHISSSNLEHINMKFVVAVVMLALAAGVQSSLLAQVAPGVSYVTPALHGAWGGAWDGAWGHGGAWGTGLGLAHAPAAVAVHAGTAWGASGHGWGVPGISLAQGPAHGSIAAAAPLALATGHGHEGVYVAKTRGAIHTAPLAGHISSATSVNVAPAPGTH
ncbi:adult cuticle protein 1-like [Teleopsis dalmanni]|uniref:adult cuticle protein 1-like n=1 Tax=Teleopsis dalmanni TaxID=139649 RepID=UPI0018CD4A98|nr:adult cuticle protein 1-like [Teleopsis dalmanni]